MNSVHYKSLTPEWATPPELFRALDNEFHFTMDVCATAQNAKCKRFLSPSDDGLTQPWDGVCWMNPPYGRQIGRWMEKAVTESWKGITVVCLVPARTDTEWWHQYAMKGEIRFLRGRVKFGGAKSGAPFPSAVIIFRQKWWEERFP